MDFLKMTRKEYTEYMIETYPKLFRQYFLPMTHTCMCWGFDIGPGWYEILDNLCKDLTELSMLTGIQIEFTQIKEKFGGARFYHAISNASPMSIYQADTLISLAETKCEYTDELTGELRNTPNEA